MARSGSAAVWTRRELLRRLAVAAAWSACPAPVAALASPGRAPGDLPAPHLDDDAVLRHVAGLRPYREGHIRLEPELLGPERQRGHLPGQGLEQR